MTAPEGDGQPLLVWAVVGLGDFGGSTEPLAEVLVVMWGEKERERKERERERRERESPNLIISCSIVIVLSHHMLQ